MSERVRFVLIVALLILPPVAILALAAFGGARGIDWPGVF